jgi:predicted dehydrogenase
MGRYWVPGLVIGYEHSFLNTIADFVESIEKGTTVETTFRGALQTQRVCEAILKSGKEERWVETGVEL